MTAPAASTGLRGRLLRGSLFEIGGYGAQQIIRFGSNLILTRLLYPAAFGQATIVSTLGTGLVMLSDVAIQPCVIQSRRGDEVAFLNTAFTLQVLRGCALALLMVLVARPAAWFYREPILESLIRIGAIQLLLNGFHSTSVFSLRRKLALGWLNALDLGTSIATVSSILILCHLHPTAQALVLGSVLGTIFGTVASHFLPVPYHNRFQWDKDAVQEIGRFSRWVLGSSTTTFLGMQSDRILLGRFLGTAWLGVYGIAANLAEMLSVLVGRVIAGVLYPALSEAGRTNRDLPSFFYRLRLRLDAFSMTAAGLLGSMGGWVVHALWDARYANAAWIVEVLSLRVAIGLIIAPMETCLFALGHTRYLFLRSLMRLISTVVAMVAGWYLWGAKGVIWATALAELPTVLAVWPKSRALGILRIPRELLAVAIFIAAYAVGRVILIWLPQIHLR
ncbi:MAG: hypothetical protein QOI66_5546 [Myxococcales bacterium]|nr:hypothetical protein [Myxococcales bacterium]